MMDPLGALVILFVVMSVVSVIGILLMYLTKEEKVKKGIFYLKDDNANKYKLTEEEDKQRAYNNSSLLWIDEKKVSYEYENRFKDLKYC